MKSIRLAERGAAERKSEESEENMFIDAKFLKNNVCA